MPELHSGSTDRGIWIDVYTNHVLTLSAHWADRLGSTPLTVYWRGRTDAKLVIDFFEHSAPKEDSNLLDALIFTPSDRFRLARLADTEELKVKLPSDVSLLRIESLSRKEHSQPYEPTFIVWSRTDLQSVPRGDPAPDSIGVWLTPSRLSDSHGSMAEFIAKTHIDKDVNYGMAKESLETLTRHVNNA